jgi:hypothetical protein
MAFTDVWDAVNASYTEGSFFLKILIINYLEDLKCIANN